MADMLSTGVSGLLAFQRSLATSSHNISNVNTEGFSRQRVELATRLPERSGAGFIGSGVTTSGVERIFNQFLTDQLRDSTTAFNRSDTFFELSSRIDNLLADPQAGLTPLLQGFFNAVQDVADDPTSTAARQALLGQAESLADRFQFLDNRLTDLAEETDSRIDTAVAEINGLASSIADLNDDIAILQASAGQPPNDLQDKRDLLITQLSERIAVTTVPQVDGAVNVFIGSGQALVLGAQATTLETGPGQFDPGRLEVNFVSGPARVQITDLLNGGSLGAALDFRDDVLLPTRNALGRTAIGLAESFNARHQLGVDLEGDLGGLFFNALGQTSPTASAASRNTGDGVLGLVVSDINALTTSDYRLDRVGADYTLTRLSDGVTTDLDAAGFPGGAVTVDGLDISLASGTIADGDSFLLRPTRFGALDIALSISRPVDVAAALPDSGAQALANAANVGTGQVDSAVVSNANLLDGDTYSILLADSTSAVGGTLAITDDPATDDSATIGYQLTINGANIYASPLVDGDSRTLDQLAIDINNAVGTGVQAFADGGTLYLASTTPGNAITVTESLLGASDAGDDVTGFFGSVLTGPSGGGSDTAAITLDAPASAYVVLDSSNNIEASGAYNPAGTTVAFNGLQVDLSGAAQLGDSFSVQAVSSGVGDNRNALLLAGLQAQNLFENGTATYQGIYGQMVASVGVQTRQAEINRDARDAALNQAVEARESVSGVNLDEEAANLLRFQQAYQAAAQVISVADTVFQTLLNATQR